MMLRPGLYDLEMWQGATFDYLFTWYSDDEGTIPVDLTDYTARVWLMNDQVVFATMESTGPNPQITLGGPLGTIRLIVADTDTSGIPVGVWNYVLSVTNTDEDESYWLLEGRIQVHAGGTL